VTGGGIRVGIDTTFGGERLAYAFTLHRKVTVVRGASGTGKTTLIELLRSLRPGERICQLPFNVLNLDDTGWKGTVTGGREQVFFADEYFIERHKSELAQAVASSTSWFVLITRGDLSGFSMSYTELYVIETVDGVSRFKRAISDLSAISAMQSDILCEDPGSGKHYLEALFTEAGAKPRSINGAGGNSAVLSRIKGLERRTLVQADGAAFGVFAEEALRACELAGHTLWLPESVEWLILNSDFMHDMVKDELDNPQAFIDNSKFNTWEEYFTHALTYALRGSKARYAKGERHRCFTEKCCHLHKDTACKLRTDKPKIGRRLLRMIGLGDGGHGGRGGAAASDMDINAF
jgi:hypothetical protein